MQDQANPSSASVTITLRGKRGSGKTVLAHKVARCLQQAGLCVTLVDEGEVGQVRPPMQDYLSVKPRTVLVQTDNA